jgi:hypothetical protein
MVLGTEKKETGFTPILPMSKCGVPRIYMSQCLRVRSEQVGGVKVVWRRRGGKGEIEVSQREGAMQLARGTQRRRRVYESIDVLRCVPDTFSGVLDEAAVTQGV